MVVGVDAGVEVEEAFYTVLSRDLAPELGNGEVLTLDPNSNEKLKAHLSNWDEAMQQHVVPRW